MDHTKVKATVLYIEDDPASKRLLQSLVDSLDGIKLVTAWSAEEGLRLAEKLMPQLIFLDINLPCMSGRDAMLELQVNPKLGSTPVYALSADGIPAHIDSAMKLGFREYLTKPVNLKQITDIIFLHCQL